MSEFEYEVLEKKKLARQSRYRKCGSKSKKCSLPTDGMTRREWEKKNGGVIVLDLNKPMYWKAFKRLSVESQREYIRNLVDVYGANIATLSRMFEVSRNALKDHFSTIDIGIEFPVGGRTSNAKKEAWEIFLSGAHSKTSEGYVSSESSVTDSTPESSVDTKSDVSPEPQTRLDCESMKMTEFYLSFDGVLDVNSISNSLRNVIGNIPRNGKLEVKFSLA